MALAGAGKGFYFMGGGSEVGTLPEEAFTILIYCLGNSYTLPYVIWDILSGLWAGEEAG